MVNFDGKYKFTLELEAQSPLIHFQARETGATVRASEVKPKLDRFLLQKLKKKTSKAEKELISDDKYKKIFLPAAGGEKAYALKYKLQIFCQKPPSVVVINNERSLTKDNSGYAGLPKYSLYYANSGIKEAGEQRLGIVSDPTVVIHCFVPELQELLSEYLEEFFLVTNFGTMQNKGFGSFAPKGYIPDPKKISAYLKEKTGTGICLLMKISTPPKRLFDFSEHFKRIESFYHLMKSGYNNMNWSREYERSFLFQYMHKKGLGNEKAWMKAKRISPDVHTSAAPKEPSSTQPEKYVRAFLGTAGNITYQKSGSGRMTVSISSKEFDRVPSPVFFKIIKSFVFIAAFPVPKNLYGKPFRFEGFKSGELSTPAMTDLGNAPFDIADFLRQYGQHYNDLIKRKILPKYLLDAPEVREI